VTFPDGVSEEEAAALRALAKEELRKRLAAVRRALSTDTRASHARNMSRLLTAEPEFEKAGVVLAYSALRFEIDPRQVIEAAWALGKSVALPRIVAETRALTLHVYRPGDELAESGFVVKEPRADAERVDPKAVDLVLVPGLAFDQRGHRLGYGQGYYDRLLPTLPNARRFGLCYELSLLVEVPAADHDVPVDALVTERRVLRAQR
jgi:5-formyltetrahydrofolate cyclo-ligase